MGVNCEPRRQFAGWCPSIGLAPSHQTSVDENLRAHRDDRAGARLAEAKSPRDELQANGGRGARQGASNTLSE